MGQNPWKVFNIYNFLSQYTFMNYSDSSTEGYTCLV